jgi:hypothetical protein
MKHKSSSKYSFQYWEVEEGKSEANRSPTSYTEIDTTHSFTSTASYADMAWCLSAWKTLPFKFTT